MNVLVTGAGGFVGRALLNGLVDPDITLYAVVRDVKKISHSSRSSNIQYRQCDLVHDKLDEILAGIDVVVHLAGRAHQTKEKSNSAFELYHRDNVLTTERLLHAAMQSSVRRFIYLSTVKVNGEGRDTPYTENDPPAPEDAYGKTKLKAEDVLRSIGSENGIETVILRPPLVYGPGVKANFRSLLQWVSAGYPLPLGAITNKRSFLFIGNLVSAINICLKHPEAANQTFLISDGEDIALPNLIRLLYKEMNKQDKLFFFPLWLLQGMGFLMGKRRTLKRLIDPLLVDNNKFVNTLNWNPPYSLAEGLQTTVKWYTAHRENNPWMGRSA